MKKAVVDIVIPVHYEQNNIEILLALIKKKVKADNRLIIVYQDENDPTAAIISKIQKKMPNVLLAKNKVGFGYAKQLITGFKLVKSPIVCIMMSDLSDDPSDVDKMVKNINSGYDFVCASRYMEGGRRIGAPFWKQFFSYYACITLHFLANIPTKDSTNAFKCFRADFLKKITIESENFELPFELAVKAHRMGLKFTNVPTTWRERTSGKSKFRFLFLLPKYLKWYFYAIKTSYF